MARHKRFSNFEGQITEEMLTDRQRQILEYIRKCVKDKGYPPAVREIGKAVGLSSSASVHNHLHKLEEYGFCSVTLPSRVHLNLPRTLNGDRKLLCPFRLLAV